MIVCWVLFSVGALAGLVGWAGSEYYDGKQEAYAEEQRQKRGSESLTQPSNEPPSVTWGQDDPVSTRII